MSLHTKFNCIIWVNKYNSFILRKNQVRVARQSFIMPDNPEFKLLLAGLKADFFNKILGQPQPGILKLCEAVFY